MLKRIKLKLALSIVAMVVNTFGVAEASVLTTTFASNNGQAGNMFDVVVKSTHNLVVTGFDLNLNAGTWAVSLYTKAGSWVGTAQSAWTLLGSNTVTSSNKDQATFFDVTDFTLNALSTSAFYVTTGSSTSSFRYTNASTNVGTVAASDSDLSVLVGAGVANLFGFAFQNRIWNGAIHYSEVTPNAVPEPTSIALLGMGALGFAASRRKKSV